MWPYPPTPSVVRLPSARLARVGLFLAERLRKLQSSTGRFAHTPLCWHTLGDPAPVEPSLCPIVCRIRVWPVVICPPQKKLLPRYNRNCFYSEANRVREDLAPSHDLVCSGLDSKGQCETNGILLAGDHVTGG